VKARPRVRHALIGAAAAFAMFLMLAWAVSAGWLLRFDAAVLGAFRQSADHVEPLGPGWLEALFGDVTSLGSFTVLGALVAVVFGFLWLDGKHHAALLVVLSAISGVLLSTLLKASFERPRPDLITHLAHVSTASFPSGHAMLSAIIYLTLGVLIARVQTTRGLRIYPILVAIALAALIGLSRLYLGVHWPSDVLAGWMVGVGWALLCYAVAGWLQQRGVVEGEPPPVASERAR
jgi:undecaprenyl-diphosphatase